MYIHIYIHIYIYIYTYKYVYIYMYLYIYVYKHIRIYMYTYTHIWEYVLRSGVLCWITATHCNILQHTATQSYDACPLCIVSVTLSGEKHEKSLGEKTQNLPGESTKSLSGENFERIMILMGKTESVKTNMYMFMCVGHRPSGGYAYRLHNTLQHNTLQHNTLQHNTLQHNTLQHNSLQHGYACCSE